MVLERSKVLEWVQPKPTVTNGEAWVAFSNYPTVSVSVLGRATSGIVSTVAPAATCLGSSSIGFAGDCEFFPSAVAGAVVDVDGSSPANDNTHYPACVAVADVGSFSDDVTVIGDGWAGVFLGPFGFPVVPQVGSASVNIDYVGGGSTPIFPFRLPVLFMVPGLTSIAGSAVLDFHGEAVFSASGVGRASVPALLGDVTPDSGVIGDNTYAIYGVAAVAGLLGGVSPSAGVEGVSAVSVTGSVGVIIGGVLPTVLPFTFV